MANETLSEQVAGSVRAELARRRLTAADIAPVLGVELRAAQRRLAGDIPFALDEIAAVAKFLGVRLASLIPSESQQAVAA